jgi:predicted RNA-binding Zn-ribbon protein involved in translation (DUF1610 family)
MAAAAGPERGVEVQCPECGATVMQKKMIPVLRDGAKGYLCLDCARKQIQPAGASAG